MTEDARTTPQSIDCAAGWLFDPAKNLLSLIGETFAVYGNRPAFGPLTNQVAL